MIDDLDDLDAWTRIARRQIAREQRWDNVLAVLGALGVIGLAFLVLHLAR